MSNKIYYKFNHENHPWLSNNNNNTQQVTEGEGAEPRLTNISDTNTGYFPKEIMSNILEYTINCPEDIRLQDLTEEELLKLWSQTYCLSLTCKFIFRLLTNKYSNHFLNFNMTKATLSQDWLNAFMYCKILLNIPIDRREELFQAWLHQLFNTRLKLEHSNSVFNVKYSGIYNDALNLLYTNNFVLEMPLNIINIILNMSVFLKSNDTFGYAYRNFFKVISCQCLKKEYINKDLIPEIDIIKSSLAKLNSEDIATTTEGYRHLKELPLEYISDKTLSTPFINAARRIYPNTTKAERQLKLFQELPLITTLQDQINLTSESIESWTNQALQLLKQGIDTTSVCNLFITILKINGMIEYWINQAIQLLKEGIDTTSVSNLFITILKINGVTDAQIRKCNFLLSYTLGAAMEDNRELHLKFIESAARNIFQRHKHNIHSTILELLIKKLKKNLSKENPIDQEIRERTSGQISWDPNITSANTTIDWQISIIFFFAYSCGSKNDWANMEKILDTLKDLEQEFPDLKIIKQEALL